MSRDSTYFKRKMREGIYSKIQALIVKYNLPVSELLEFLEQTPIIKEQLERRRAERDKRVKARKQSKEALEMGRRRKREKREELKS